MRVTPRCTLAVLLELPDVAAAAAGATVGALTEAAARLVARAAAGADGAVAAGAGAAAATAAAAGARVAAAAGTLTDASQGPVGLVHPPAGHKALEMSTRACRIDAIEPFA